MTEPQRPADLEDMAAAWQAAAEQVRAGMEEFIRSLGIVAAQWQISALRAAQTAGRPVIPRPKFGDPHALSQATAAVVQRHAQAFSRGARLDVRLPRPKFGDMHALTEATAAAVQRHTAPALDRMNRAAALQARQNRHTGPRPDPYRHRGR